MSCYQAHASGVEQMDNRPVVPFGQDEQVQYLQETFTMIKSGKTSQAIERCIDFSKRTAFGEVAQNIGKLWVTLDNSNDRAWAYLGLVSLNIGQDVQATQILEKALAINPDSDEATLSLFNVWHKRGDFKKAREYVDILIKTHGQTVPIINDAMARLYWAMGQNDVALVLAEKNYTIAPNSPYTNYFLGKIYAELGQLDKAISFFTHCTELEPLSPIYWYNLGLLYDKKGQLDKAEQAMETALAAYNRTDISQEKHLDERNRIAAFLDKTETFYKTFKMASLDELELPRDSFVESIRKVNERHEMIELTDTVTPANEWMFLHGDRAYVDMLMTNDDKILLGSKNAHSELILKKDFPRKKYSEPCIILGGALNYYHWICDYLPRMSIIDACPDLADLPIIVHHELKDFHKDSLRALGYDDLSRFICVPRKHYLDFEHAYIPHIKHRPMSVDGKYDLFEPALTKETLMDIRKWFSSYMVLNTEFPKRIFVSRVGAKYRRCENEDAVFEIAREYDFEKIRNEDLSFTEQIALYSGAEAVMGVHGAGFTNMIFAQEGTSLIELFPRQAEARFFGNICHLLHHHQYCIFGNRTNTLGLPTREFWDFEVNLDDVKMALDKLGKKWV